MIKAEIVEGSILFSHEESKINTTIVRRVENGKMKVSARRLNGVVVPIKDILTRLAG